MSIAELRHSGGEEGTKGVHQRGGGGGGGPEGSTSMVAGGPPAVAVGRQPRASATRGGGVPPALHGGGWGRLRSPSLARGAQRHPPLARPLPRLQWCKRRTVEAAEGGGGSGPERGSQPPPGEREIAQLDAWLVTPTNPIIETAVERGYQARGGCVDPERTT